MLHSVTDFGEVSIGCICICPLRRNKRFRTVCLPDLEGAAHAHSAIVGNLRCIGLAIFFGALTAHPELCTRQWGKNAVTGAIGKVGGANRVISFCGQLPAGYGNNAVAFRIRTKTGAVHKRCNVGFGVDLLKQNAIPHRIIGRGIAVEILQTDFFQDAGFPVIFTVSTADGNADLTGGVAAEHRTVMHQHNANAFSGCSNGTEHTGHTTAYNAQISFMNNSFHGKTSFVSTRSQAIYSSSKGRKSFSINKEDM